MIRWGNRRANEYWEAHVPEDYYIPDENDSVPAVERWIRDKYERGKFKAKHSPKWADDDVDLSKPLNELLGDKSSKEKKEKKDKEEKKESKMALKAPSVAAPAPAAKPAAAPAPAPASDPFDLLGFDAFPVAAPAPAAAKSSVNELTDAFGSFGVSASTAAAVGASAPSAAQVAASKASGILDLYATQQPAHNNPFAGPGLGAQQQMMGAAYGQQMGFPMGMQQQQQPMMQMGGVGVGYGAAAMPGMGMPMATGFPQVPPVAAQPAKTGINAIDPFASF